MKKVLFVLTSHDQLGNTGEKTGFWIEEFASPYYVLRDHDIHVDLASPNGGQPPIDPKSALPEFATPSTARFNADATTQELLSRTFKLEGINESDYDGVFYPGGHGPLWDLSEDTHSIALIESFYRHHKPVAFVCHAPGALRHVKNIDGTPLVTNKTVTGFTNAEEDAVHLTNVVPFLVEDMLQENGGVYSKGPAWAPYAVSDGFLITGQNPASSELVANKLLDAINQ